jgi:hypothetical protein
MIPSPYTDLQRHAFELATGLLLQDDTEKWQSGVRLQLMEMAVLENHFKNENTPYNAYDLAEAYLEYRRETLTIYRARHENLIYSRKLRGDPQT